MTMRAGGSKSNNDKKFKKKGLLNDKRYYSSRVFFIGRKPSRLVPIVPCIGQGGGGGGGGGGGAKRGETVTSPQDAFLLFVLLVLLPTCRRQLFALSQTDAK